METDFQLLYRSTSPWQLFSLVTEYELNVSLPCRFYTWPSFQFDTALDRNTEAKEVMRKGDSLTSHAMVPKRFCWALNCSVFPSVCRALDKAQSWWPRRLPRLNTNANTTVWSWAITPPAWNTNSPQAGAAQVATPQETASSNANKPHFLGKIFSFEWTRNGIDLKASFASKIY